MIKSCKLVLFIIVLVSFSMAETVVGQRPQRSGTQRQRARKYYLDEPRTDLEEFQDRLQEVILKGLINVGAVNGRNGWVQVSAVELKSPAYSTRVTGLVIQLSESARPNSEIQSFIDYAEIDSMIKGLDAVAHADDTVT